MSSYRFCRTDDIGLLVDALNRCWLPHAPDQDPVTPAAFKRSIRDLQVWCSSCMVAFSGGDPIAVLIGAKRPGATLIHRIAVHPDHLRQGHGRHLLTSLSSKLAILGPPRLVAEVPEMLGPARALFEACGYVEEGRLTDYVRPSTSARSTSRLVGDRFVVPVTVDDLVANGLLENQPDTCWERSVETLAARKEEIAGFAVASEERIEAYLLYIAEEIVALRAHASDPSQIEQLLAQLTFTAAFRRVHPAEFAPGTLERLGFQPGAAYRRYATTARSA